MLEMRDPIATLITEMPGTIDNPDRRSNIAVSVAIGRIADFGCIGSASGPTYTALIKTWHDWRLGSTPQDSAAFVHEHFGWQANQLAILATAVADYIETSSADLLDDGATVAVWREYARALRSPGPGSDR